MPDFARVTAGELSLTITNFFGRLTIAHCRNVRALGRVCYID